MTVLTKRILSMVLALCLCVAMLPAVAMQAEAASYNAVNAIAYANVHWNDGKGLCAEFVSDCLAAGGVTIPNNSSYYSSATQSYNNNSGTLGVYTNPYTCSASLLLYLSQYYTVITNPTSNQIEVGDVVFMKNGEWRDGHVGIIISTDGGVPVYAAHNRATNTGRFYNNHPCTYVVKMNGKLAGEHECNKDTYVYYEAVHPHYKCYKCSICGEVSRNTQESTIVDSCSICISPGKPTLTGMQRVYEPGSPITFSWEDTENTTHYNIWLHEKDVGGEWTKYEHVKYVSNGVKKDLPDGEYRCLVQSYNSNYWLEDGSDWLYTESDWVYFVVGDHDCDKGEYVYYWKAHPHYNCYKCSVCGEIWPDRASSNFIDSCLECQKPQKPEFTNLKDVYLNSDTITFEWKPTENTTHYNIWLNKKDADGEWTKYEHLRYVSNGVQKNLPDGEYRCTLQSYNSSYRLEDGSDWLYTESDPFYFKVITNTAIEYPAGKITIESAETKAGDTVSVAVYLENNPGVAYAKFKVDYSDALTLVSAEDQAVLSGTFTTSQTLDVKPYVLQWMGADNSTKNGCFVILTFRVAEDAKDGVYDITMMCSEAYNADYEDVQFTITNASVTVTSHLPGDINGDGKVNGKDGVLFAQHLAEWGVTINMDAADVNGDGKVNGKDGILLAQYLAEWDVILG